MKSAIVTLLTLTSLATSVALVACSHNEPGASTGGSPGVSAAAGGAAPPPGPSSVSDKDCSGDFVIEDAEDNNNQVMKQGGRNGYWYTFIDTQGSTISPPAKTKFLMSPGGVKGSGFAAHVLGKMSGSGDPLYGGLGFSFTDPKAPFDATAYSGIAFYAKVGQGSTKEVRLKVPDINTDPAGKVCTECFNDFGYDLNLTDQWQKYTIPFSQMKQMEGWGSPQKSSIDKSKLYAVQWQINKPGATYDIWIDNVQFAGCP